MARLFDIPLNEFGLSEKSMNIIREIYSKFPQIQKVAVYGSRAKGNFREGSDIDMAIFADSAFSCDDLSEVCDLFDESYLPYFVDICDFAALKNPDLITSINRFGKILYERGKIVH